MLSAFANQMKRTRIYPVHFLLFIVTLVMLGCADAEDRARKVQIQRIVSGMVSEYGRFQILLSPEYNAPSAERTTMVEYFSTYPSFPAHQYDAVVFRSLHLRTAVRAR